MARIPNLASVLLPLVLVLQIGCSGSLAKLDPFLVYDEQAERGTGGIEVTYLGTSGFLLRRGTDAILIDPFFSNPRFLKVALGLIESDTGLIDSCLEEVDADVDEVDAILVSHAHYDHLMDVPYVAFNKAKRACVYTSLTGKNIVQSQFTKCHASRLISLIEAEEQALEDAEIEDQGAEDQGAGDSDDCKKRVPLCQGPPFEPCIEISSGIRVMPVFSGHPPHIGQFSFFGGFHREPLDKVPARAAGYRKGRVYSFVIDFVTPGKPVQVDFRIYIQGSADGVIYGFPPRGVDDFDLAILSAAGHHKVPQHPDGILKRLKPKRVLVSHWESFFRPLHRKPRTVPGTDVRAFLDKVKNAVACEDKIPTLESFILPAPGSRVVYPIRSRRDSHGALDQRSSSLESCRCFDDRESPMRASSSGLKKGGSKRRCYWSVNVESDDQAPATGKR